MLLTKIYNFLFTVESKIDNQRLRSLDGVQSPLAVGGAQSRSLDEAQSILPLRFVQSPTGMWQSQSFFWLGLSLIFAVIYSFLALQKAFSGEYIIQDDARQHVFWMSRFMDSELFPDDLIANYFQSIAPWGYKNLYRIFASFGLDPLVFNRILPGIISLVMTGYCFAVTLELLPIPFAGFIAALMLNQNLWMQDGLISGTAKAFIYPIFLAFLYYWLRRSLVGVCLTILLLSWFYPSLVLISAGVLFLQLWRIQGYFLRLQVNKNIYLLSCIGLVVAFIALLPYVVAISEYGPTITLEQARNLPEFTAGGRVSFFYDHDPWEFWFNASRSGVKLPSALIPPLAYGGLLLPLLLKFPRQFPLSQKVNPKITYLANLLLVSFTLFFIAHALLFKLHLPSRYTQHSLKIIIILAASIALVLIIEALLSWAKNSQSFYRFKSAISLMITCLAIIILVGYPASLKNFIHTGYQVGTHPELYKFFQQQPKNTLIASLTAEADSLPSFTQRSILVSREYAIPYHWGYYQAFRKRVIDLIEAQYSTDLKIVQDLIDRYGVDYWLIEQSSFTPEYLEQNRWLIDHQQVTQKAILDLKAGKIPVINRLQDSCSVFRDQQYTVISSQCIKTSFTSGTRS
ncbi:hypothetical protein [Pleurocapsa sp. PCC 7319]|uniref:hypothetical protein n=1 Tax=Pleurocapsa sp. PCC 7319 TaxID=118161 RepID=UPI000370B827|nr:hypothetical protein [Pleurocapsa sp. PCC 7319]